MQIIKKYWKNTVILFCGVILMALGGALFVVSEKGSDALMVLNQGIATALKLEVGYGIIIGNAIAFIIMLFICPKKIGLGTFVITLLLGTLVNLFLSLKILPTPQQDWQGILITIIGIIIGGLGTALYIYSSSGLSAFEAIIITVQEKLNTKFWIIKIISDLIFFLIGWLLGGVFGIGSIMTIFLYGPVIDLFLKILKKMRILNKE